MSIQRAMRRAADRKRPVEDRRWPRKCGPVSEVNQDGSIRTLRPTKGWLRTSAKRVALRIEAARRFAVELAGIVPDETAEEIVLPVDPETDGVQA